MAAIYKREMHSYLTSAVGYVFLAVFFAISGYYFFATSLVSNSTDLSYVFSNLFSIAIFLVPLLTMKLFSEERKQRTEQLLFTAPVRFTGVVLGKFFASLTMYLLGMSVTLVYFLVMCAFRVPDVAVFAGNFLGLLLLGAALLASAGENALRGAVLTAQNITQAYHAYFPAVPVWFSDVPMTLENRSLTIFFCAYAKRGEKSEVSRD